MVCGAGMGGLAEYAPVTIAVQFPYDKQAASQAASVTGFGSFAPPAVLQQGHGSGASGTYFAPAVG